MIQKNMIQKVSSALNAGASPPAAAYWAKTSGDIASRMAGTKMKARRNMASPYLFGFVRI